MGKIYDKLMEYKQNNKGTVVWRAKRHCGVVEKHLNQDEDVLFVFGGQKNDRFYDICTSCVVVLTNKRILIGQKRVVWGYFLKSITPDLFNDLSVYHGLIWGKVTIDTVKEQVVLSNVSKYGLDDIETNVFELMDRENHSHDE